MMHEDLHHPQELPKGHTLGLGVVKCEVRLRFRGSSYVISSPKRAAVGTQDTCVAPLRADGEASPVRRRGGDARPRKARHARLSKPSQRLERVDPLVPCARMTTAVDAPTSISRRIKSLSHSGRRWTIAVRHVAKRAFHSSVSQCCGCALLRPINTEWCIQLAYG